MPRDEFLSESFLLSRNRTTQGLFTVRVRQMVLSNEAMLALVISEISDVCIFRQMSDRMKTSKKPDKKRQSSARKRYGQVVLNNKS